MDPIISPSLVALFFAGNAAITAFRVGKQVIDQLKGDEEPSVDEFLGYLGEAAEKYRELRETGNLSGAALSTGLAIEALYGTASSTRQVSEPVIQAALGLLDLGYDELQAIIQDSGGDQAYKDAIAILKNTGTSAGTPTNITA